MGIMEVFVSTREICRCARENFNRLMTVRDSNGLRHKSGLMDGHYHVVRVKDSLRGHCVLRHLKRGGIVRYAFSVLHGVHYLVD